MKILITGIKGFLGTKLIDVFREKGYELYGLGKKEEIFKNIQVYDSADLDNINVIPDVIIICHAAVSSGDTIVSNDLLFDVNVLLTEKICNKFRDSFLIYVSTASVYNSTCAVITEKSELEPQSNYALSKLWGEYILKFHKRITIIRLSSLYGIGMKENTLIPNFINQALDFNIIKVWGDGSRIQNYVHVQDVANLIKIIVIKENTLKNKIFLGVSQKGYSNLEIAKIIANETNSKIIFINEDKSKSLIYNSNYTHGLTSWKSEQIMKENLNDYIKWKKGEF